MSNKPRRNLSWTSFLAGKTYNSVSQFITKNTVGNIKCRCWLNCSYLNLYTSVLLTECKSCILVVGSWGQENIFSFCCFPLWDPLANFIFPWKTFHRPLPCTSLGTSPFGTIKQSRRSLALVHAIADVMDPDAMSLDIHVLGLLGPKHGDIISLPF